MNEKKRKKKKINESGYSEAHDNKYACTKHIIHDTSTTVFCLCGCDEAQYLRWNCTSWACSFASDNKHRSGWLHKCRWIIEAYNVCTNSCSFFRARRLHIHKYTNSSCVGRVKYGGGPFVHPHVKYILLLRLFLNICVWWIIIWKGRLTLMNQLRWWWWCWWWCRRASARTNAPNNFYL